MTVNVHRRNQPRSIALFGATSDIGCAIVNALATDQLQHLVLAGRDPVRTRRLLGAALQLPDHVDVATVVFDARETGHHDQIVDDLFTAGTVDLVIVAFGRLGTEDDQTTDPDDAVEVATTNYVGTVSTALRVIDKMRTQGHGTVVVLSSIAAVRPRRHNFVYGSSKSGLDAFARGLQLALADTNVRVVIVRPGFVHSTMTAGRAPAPWATTPADVARATVKGLEHDRRTVWVPSKLRWVGWALLLLPFRIMRRMTR